MSGKDLITKSNTNNNGAKSNLAGRASLLRLHQGFSLADVIVEPDSGVVIRNGERFHLAPKAMEVLVFLASKECQLVSRQEILEFGWGDKSLSSTNVTHTISEIRHALGDHIECPTFIQTVPRKGYRLMVPCEEKAMANVYALQHQAQGSHQRWSLPLSILKSSRLFKASVAYVIISWVLLQVFAVILPIFSAPDWTLKAVTLILIIGFPLVLTVQWFSDLRQKRRSAQQHGQPSRFFYQQLAVDSFFVGIVLVVIYFLSTHLITYIDEEAVASATPVSASITKPISDNAVAVMTFKLNDADNYALAQIQDELITILANRPEYKVASLRAVQVLSATDNLATIKNRLGVRYLIEGSASVINNNITADLQLIDTLSGFQIWGGKVATASNDIYSFYQRLGREVINALAQAIPSNEISKIATMPTENSDAFDYYLQGKAQLRDNKTINSLTDAINSLKQALVLDPSFVNASASLCQAYMEIYLLSSDTSYFQQGSDVCEMTASYQASSVASYLSLGKLNLTKGRINKAQQYLYKGLEIDSESIPMLKTLAKTFAKQQQIEKAQELFLRAIKLEPDFWQNYYDYGLMFFESGQYQQAIEQFNKALTLNSEAANLFNALGGTYFLLMNWQSASDNWSQALALEPTAMTYANLATSYFYDQKFEQAAKTYQKSLELAPNNHIVWANLADAYKYSHDQQHLALETYQTALTMAQELQLVNPQSKSLRSKISRYYSEIGDCNNANAYRKELLKSAISDPYTHYSLALVGINCQQLLSTEQHLLQAIELGYPKDLILADPQFLVYKHQLNNIF
ncbi:tetratricopeptide repeat protein [Thalassotalea maritima]|uniref:tetratricopeptide repeat protein n=1 Tax=Thalassotalea maritima TaxID=3242416 RepID=UPI0035272B12